MGGRAEREQKREQDRERKREQMTAPDRPTAGTLAGIRARRDEIIATARRRGARDVTVIGSVARGTDGEDSDVDFLVTFEPGRSLIDLGGLTADLEQLLGRPVDVVTLADLRPHIRESVLSESVEL